MKLQAIPTPAGTTLKPEVLSSFNEAPNCCEVSGPGALMRLVQARRVTPEGIRLDASRRDGLFWTDESLLQRIQNQARLDLAKQDREAGRPFAASMPALVSLYARHVLRNELAICKDWTEEFDAYVRIPLLPGDRLVAWVGPVAPQPTYSASHSRHEAVKAQGIILNGTALQYVIDFNLRGNEPYRARIQGPWEL